MLKRNEGKRESLKVRKNKGEEVTDSRKKKDHSLDVLVNWIFHFG